MGRNASISLIYLALTDVFWHTLTFLGHTELHRMCCQDFNYGGDLDTYILAVSELQSLRLLESNVKELFYIRLYLMQPKGGSGVFCRSDHHPLGQLPCE